MRTSLRAYERQRFIGLTTPNVGENVEKRESLCTVSGSVNWFSQYRKQYGHLFKK